MGHHSKQRKLRRYMENEEFSKMKSYIKKHQINIKTFQFEGGGTLLHLACELGQEHTIRYLLKKGSDLQVADNDGDLPLHKACHYAMQGHKYAYSDVILPLIRQYPTAVRIPNKKNVTPRDMLQVIERNLSAPDQASDVEDDNEEESAWHERLQQEAEDEYTQAWGNYEQDYLEEDRAPDTYDNWADQMMYDYRRKQRKRAGFDSDEETARKRQKEQNEETQREFQRKLEKEHEEYMKRAETKRTERLVEKKKEYELRCEKLFISDWGSGVTSALSYGDIPWPYDSKKKSSDLLENVKEFLLCDINADDKDAIKKCLKEQQIRWHPDKFMQKCGSRLSDKHRVKIMDRVKELSQILNKLVMET